MQKLLLILAASFAAVATAEAELFQAPYGPNGSWNLYEVVDSRATWLEAHQDASSRTQMGVKGHLPDVHSGTENRMLGQLLPELSWIGLTDREGMAPATVSGGILAPQESSSQSDPQSQGWAWTSGASFDYQSWVDREPNDFRGEDAVFIGLDGRWNDLSSGLLSDQPIEPTLQPSTSSDESNGARFPYLVEYPTQQPDPFSDITRAPVPAPLMPPVLPGAEGGIGFIGVTDFFTDEAMRGPIANISQTLISIANGELTARVVSGDQAYNRTDVTDPDTNLNGGPILSGVPLQFPGGGGDEFISVGKGWVDVPAAGTYTIQVHTDDGFSLQLPGRSFRANSGGLREGDVLFFPGDTSDSKTLGVIDLPAGPQELRFYMWERNAGAYWEITTAQGDRPAAARYLAIGDASVIESTDKQPAVRLTTDVTVANVTMTNGASIETARDAVLAALDANTAFVRTDLDLLVIKDENAICCGRPGDTLIDSPFVWPLNDPEYGGVAANQDHFSSLLSGKLTVDDGDGVPGEVIPITIAMFSSDGAQFHIWAADFIAGNDNADLSYKIGGDVTLTFPEATGNSNAFGMVELTEGVEYDFDGVHFENEGDAGYEIWTAIGNHLAGFDPVAFSPLSRTATGSRVPGNQGWALIAPPQIQRGDYNSDGRLDSVDLDLQAQAITTQDLSLDENRDGTVDLHDRTIWVHDLKQTWMGDVDLDGQFDSSDLVRVFRAGKYESGLSADWSTGDWDGDFAFNSSDLVIVFADGGFEAGPRSDVFLRTVPEPSSTVTSLIGLLGMLIGSRHTPCAVRKPNS